MERRVEVLRHDVGSVDQRVFWRAERRSEKASAGECVLMRLKRRTFCRVLACVLKQDGGSSWVLILQ